MGEYDLVAAVELPDDETAMVLAMSLTQQGFVTTTTMKAFEIDLVQRLSSTFASSRSIVSKATRRRRTVVGAGWSSYPVGLEGPARLHAVREP